MRVVQETLCLSALGAAVLLCLSNWNALPKRIPIHFGLSGKADAFAGREALWAVVAIEAVIFVGVSLISRFPRLYNLPASRSDPRRPRMEELAIEMIGWVKVEVLWLFSFIVWRMIAIADGAQVGLGVLLLPIFLATLAATIGLYAVRSRAIAA